ncbi:hypothetical protein E4T56_gene752 [Termitomyces sp. T112]|nr:hypothetical protein E4T56_gene752 [Termitomyces sp. T112]
MRNNYTSYAPCLWHGPVALASSQTQPHSVQLGPCISNSMLHPQTQPHFVWSLYFQLNAKSQTQPHFVWLGLCISNSMLSPRPNLTLFDPTSLCLVRSLSFKLNAKSQTQLHFVRLGLCISNSMLSPRPNFTSFMRLGPQYSTQCFIPDPTSLHLVRSLYFVG